MKIEQSFDILIQRRGAIGDVVMTTGVVRELKKRYGANANIDVATDFAEVYRNNPHVRNIFPVDQIPAASNWQLYINLDDAYELNPENHYVDNYFYRAFGSTEFDKSVELFPTNEDCAGILNFQTENELTTYIVVHMRNWAWGAKNISMDVWLDVFVKLFEVRTDFKIVCVGGTSDHYLDHPLLVDARAKFTSQQLKFLCNGARAFVGIDSGPFQCAAASNTPIVALLTHLNPERIMPFGSRTDTAIPTLEDCRGCNDRQRRPVRQIVCAKSTYPCISNFDTGKIAKAVLELL